ncbi:hypothetical protein F5B20DRAFT_595996 [Whalleya microplaca]|nr:hypothetical protein F5B20DRAFT_595996 [Whalleya microplaca]
MLALSRILLAGLLVLFSGIAIGADLQSNATLTDQVTLPQITDRSIVTSTAGYNAVTVCNNNEVGPRCSTTVIHTTPWHPTPTLTGPHYTAIPSPVPWTTLTRQLTFGDEGASQAAVSFANTSQTIYARTGGADSVTTLWHQSTKSHLSSTSDSHSRNNRSSASSPLSRTTRRSSDVVSTSSRPRPTRSSAHTSLSAHSTISRTSTLQTTKSVTTIFPQPHSRFNSTVRFSPRNDYDGYGYGGSADQTPTVNGGYGTSAVPTNVPLGGYGNPPPAVDKPGPITITSASTTVLGTITITVSLDVHVPSTIESVITSTELFTNTLVPEVPVVNTTQTVPGLQTPTAVVTTISNTLKSADVPTTSQLSYLYTAASASSIASHSTSTMTVMQSPTISPPPKVEQNSGDYTADLNKQLLFLVAVAATMGPAGANLLAGFALAMRANNLEAKRKAADEAKKENTSGDNGRDGGDGETKVDDARDQHGASESSSTLVKDRGLANKDAFAKIQLDVTAKKSAGVFSAFVNTRMPLLDKWKFGLVENRELVEFHKRLVQYPLSVRIGQDRERQDRILSIARGGAY